MYLCSKLYLGYFWFQDCNFFYPFWMVGTIFFQISGKYWKKIYQRVNWSFGIVGYTAYSQYCYSKHANLSKKAMKKIQYQRKMVKSIDHHFSSKIYICILS